MADNIGRKRRSEHEVDEVEPSSDRERPRQGGGVKRSRKGKWTVSVSTCLCIFFVCFGQTTRYYTAACRDVRCADAAPPPFVSFNWLHSLIFLYLSCASC